MQLTLGGRERISPLKKEGENVSITIKFPIKLGAGIYSIIPAIAILHTDEDLFSPTDVEVLDSLEDHIWIKVIHDKYTGLLDLEAEIEIGNVDNINKSDLT